MRRASPVVSIHPCQGGSVHELPGEALLAALAALALLVGLELLLLDDSWAMRRGCVAD